MVGQRVLLGVSWEGGEPFIRLRDDTETSSRLEPAVGFELTYRVEIEGPRVCTGHKPFRSGGPEYVDCTQKPQPGGPTCRTCAIVEATFASNLHHAHTKETIGIDPAIADHLRQSNLLYLAAFRDGSIKVGTSTERRIATRLAEQGAWKAFIVARATDGVSVRVLEDAVSAALELPQSVSATRKLTGLVRPVNDTEIVSALTQHRDAVHRMLKVPTLASLAPDVFTALQDEWHFSGTDDALWAKLHRYPVSLKTGSHDVQIIAACGRLMLLRKPGGTDHFVADVRPLFGRLLEWGHFGSEPLAVQDSLF